MATPAPKTHPDTLRTLPGDDVRQIMWRFPDRYDLQMLVQSARGVARGPVARLVAEGGRSEHEWTARKNELLAHYDASGITAAFMEPEEGGFISGPKNLALSLAAFELAWVDAGAATGALAGFLGLSPIHERGTPEQALHYMSLAAPAKPGEDRRPWRAAFALTEPIPYVGVDTGVLRRRAPELLERVRLSEWADVRVKKFSKGMTQRLGLAAALVHDPEVLLLDEPTDGVDPVGRREIRDLLQEEAKRGKTVLLNSHLLSEIERTCDRVAVLRAGRVAAAGRIEDLTASGSRYKLVATGVDDALLAAFRETGAAVERVNGHFDLSANDLDHVNALVDRLRAAGGKLQELTPVRSSLEDVFVDLVRETEANPGVGAALPPADAGVAYGRGPAAGGRHAAAPSGRAGTSPAPTTSHDRGDR